MQISGNTILITGGGSGIGRGLAEAFHREGNHVIIAGRRKEALDEVVTANPGMSAEVLDIRDAENVRQFASTIVEKYPALNAVMHNSGIMVVESLSDGSTKTAEDTIATNLLGPIWLNSALLQQLLKQPRATIFTVTSGLAYVPSILFPTYCATKAALHSWTESLRYQLRKTAVQVIELIPPYVQTGLTGEHQKTDATAMPLDDYLRETFAILKEQPEVKEVVIDRVKSRRFAAQGDYQGFFTQMNEASIAARGDVSVPAK